MEVREAYNRWAEIYDTNENKTRDLEAVALKTVLSGQEFENVLEMGCGTGKNTGWLVSVAHHVTAVDFSEEMIARAKEKIISEKVIFRQADILQSWNFADRQYDLVTFSLVLEHVDDLDEIFRKVSQVTKPGGLVYVGELHPFKQYLGTKARFETENGAEILPCFTHHISDFVHAAKSAGFKIYDFSEFFDDDDRNGLPRILAILFLTVKNNNP